VVQVDAQCAALFDGVFGGCCGVAAAAEGLHCAVTEPAGLWAVEDGGALGGRPRSVSFGGRDWSVPFNPAGPLDTTLADRVWDVSTQLLVVDAVGAPAGRTPAGEHGPGSVARLGGSPASPCGAQCGAALAGFWRRCAGALGADAGVREGGVAASLVSQTQRCGLPLQSLEAADLAWPAVRPTPRGSAFVCSPQPGPPVGAATTEDPGGGVLGVACVYCADTFRALFGGGPGLQGPAGAIRPSAICGDRPPPWADAPALARARAAPGACDSECLNAARQDEGRLSFCTVMFAPCTYPPYKRAWARHTDSTTLV
jgi:hypothetical protein